MEITEMEDRILQLERTVLNVLEVTEKLNRAIETLNNKIELHMNDMDSAHKV